MTFIFKNFDLRAATWWFPPFVCARLTLTDAALQTGMWKLFGANYVYHITDYAWSWRNKMCNTSGQEFCTRRFLLIWC